MTSDAFIHCMRRYEEDVQERGSSVDGPSKPIKNMNQCPASPALSDKSGLLIGGLSLAPVHADSLTLLISALQEQTAALNRLASSNESLSQAVSSLIDEMANAEEQDPDAEPSTYLDGSKVR